MVFIIYGVINLTVGPYGTGNKPSVTWSTYLCILYDGSYHLVPHSLLYSVNDQRPLNTKQRDQHKRGL